MKYVIVFGTLAIALAFNAFQVEAWWTTALLLSTAICFTGVSLAYAGAGPRIFLKTKDGRLSVLSWLLFWPYHSLNWLSLIWFRKRARQEKALFTEIQPNLWLGARLSEKDAAQWFSEGASILDVAGELSENHIFRQARNYRSLPTLDRYPPSIEALKDGAGWIAARMGEGPVYVHCALGHGRSATFIVAYLLTTKQVDSIDEAIALLKSRRARVDLSPLQIQTVKKLTEAPN